LTKSEVRGGGKKPWRQKGLGRARSGSIRSPLWKGGGVIFGPKPFDRDKNISKKQKIKALRSVFYSLSQAGRLKVYTDFELKTHKTKDFLKLTDGLIENREENTVFITAEYDSNMSLATRNLKNIKVLYVTNLDLLPIFYADRVLISEAAMERLGSMTGFISQGAKL
jgi:large subunit ribosomal protein L4